MCKTRIILSLALAGAFLTGCKDDTKPTAVPATPAQPTPQVGGSTETPSMPSTSTVPPISVPTTLPSTLPSVTITPPSLPTLPDAGTTSTPSSSSTDTSASTAGGDANAQAKTMLAQAEKDISDKNWDAAKADMAKLMAMKDKLSPEMQDMIKNAQTKMVTSQAAGSLGIPGLGGGSNTPSEPNK